MAGRAKTARVTHTKLFGRRGYSQEGSQWACEDKLKVRTVAFQRTTHNFNDRFMCANIGSGSANDRHHCCICWRAVTSLNDAEPGSSTNFITGTREFRAISRRDEPSRDPTLPSVACQSLLLRGGQEFTRSSIQLLSYLTAVELLATLVIDSNGLTIADDEIVMYGAVESANSWRACMSVQHTLLTRAQ